MDFPGENNEIVGVNTVFSLFSGSQTVWIMTAKTMTDRSEWNTISLPMEN